MKFFTKENSEVRGKDPTEAKTNDVRLSLTFLAHRIII
jgi:hypothetical protein